MKISFLIGSLNGGGAERVISMLANKFSDENEIDIIVWNNENHFYELDRNIKVHNLNLVYSEESRGSHLLFNLKRVITLVKKLREIKPTIFISFIISNNILAIISARLCGIPVIISERSELFTRKISSFWFKLRKLTYRFADLLVLQTNGAYQLVVKHKLQAKNNVVIPNPIILNEGKSYGKENVILFVGRLSKEKHVIDLLNAFAMIENKDYVLWVVGDGPEMSSLVAAVDNLGLAEKVVFWGSQKSPEKFYQKAKIFVLPSISEGFPNVLLEAMNYEDIVVSSNCQMGPAEIIEDRVSGFLYEPGNVDSLAGILFDIINDFQSYELMTVKATEKLRDYALPIVAEKWYDYICMLVNANKSRK